MYSSCKKDLILEIYNDPRSVFKLSDVAMLIEESNFSSLNSRLNYFVSKGKLLHPRKGIYAKADYKPQDLACRLYTPSYISLEYVLQRAGVIFQYDEQISSVSYLSRSLKIEDQSYCYHKIKAEILITTEGITQNGNINIACPERAFLDLLYLNKTYYFDNLNPLDKKLINKLLAIYNSKALSNRVNHILKDA